MLKFSVQSQTPFIPIIGEQRRHVVDLAEARLARLDRESFSVGGGMEKNNERGHFIGKGVIRVRKGLLGERSTIAFELQNNVH